MDKPIIALLNALDSIDHIPLFVSGDLVFRVDQFLTESIVRFKVSFSDKPATQQQELPFSLWFLPVKLSLGYLQALRASRTCCSSFRFPFEVVCTS